MLRRATLMLALALPAGLAHASEAIELSEASVPPAAKGADVPLSLMLHNPGDADALLRTRCSAATFTESHVVDHGEGFPAMRTVKVIALAGHASVQLQPDGDHVMLLQATQALSPGDRFTCHLTFRTAEAQDVEVVVRPAG